MVRKSLDDQVVVITGASQGIGRATALELARRGARVVVAARNEQALRALVSDIEAEGGQAEAVVADVAEFDQVQRIGSRAVERFGTVDTWVNNAAVAAYATVEQLSADELDRIIRVNLLGQMYGCKVAITCLKPH